MQDIAMFRTEGTDVLPREYAHLAHIAGARFYAFDRVRSPEEKARFLEWPLERIAVTRYFQIAGGNDTLPVPVYGVALSATDRYDLGKVAGNIEAELGSFPEGVRVRTAREKYLPELMKNGDCGPFLSHADAQRRRSFRPFLEQLETSARYPLVQRVFVDIDVEGALDFVVPGRPEISIHATIAAVMAVQPELYRTARVREHR